jgi:hypothetical protein
MKNKNKKLSSPKSVLKLLQQLQVKYFGRCAIEIMAYTTGSITVYIFTNSSKYGVFEFASYNNEPWDSIYQRVLDYLKENNNE